MYWTLYKAFKKTPTYLLLPRKTKENLEKQAQELQEHLQDLQGHLQDLQEHLQDLFEGGFERF